MCKRFSGFGALGSLLMALLVASAACSKTDAENGKQKNDPQTNSKAAPSAAAPAPETVARLHWVGIKHALAGTNASIFKSIWQLPETAKLVSQTFDKLALAPWRQSIPDLESIISKSLVPSTNVHVLVTNYQPYLAQAPSAALLRPLLDDLIQEEVYFEGRNLADQPGELTLAVRLGDARAGLWRTNLSSILEKAGGTATTAPESGFALRFTNGLHSAGGFAFPACTVSLSRSGGWTFFSISPNERGLTNELSARIAALSSSPSAQGGGTDAWLELDAQPRQLAAALGFGTVVPAGVPAVSLAVTPEPTNLVTTGTFRFAKELPFQVEKWQVPTSLIHEPLFSFMAVQGFGRWLSQCSAWKKLDVAETPNQFFSWSQSGNPFLNFFAVPDKAATNLVDKLSDRLMEIGNPILSSNRMGVLERATNYNGLTWHKVPLLNPFLKSVEEDEGNYVFGGLTSDTLTNGAAPLGTLAELINTPNLVYFDRESTGPRLESLLYVGQLSRIVFRRTQLPGESASVTWLKAIFPKIGSATTKLSMKSGTELSLRRTSGIGLDSFGLHLLAEWLESPTFPEGLHSALRRLPPLPPPHQAPTPSHPTALPPASH